MQLVSYVMIWNLLKFLKLNHIGTIKFFEVIVQNFLVTWKNSHHGKDGAQGQWPAGYTSKSKRNDHYCSKRLYSLSKLKSLCLMQASLYYSTATTLILRKWSCCNFTLIGDHNSKFRHCTFAHTRLVANFHDPQCLF